MREYIYKHTHIDEQPDARKLKQIGGQTDGLMNEKESQVDKYILVNKQTEPHKS